MGILGKAARIASWPLAAAALAVPLVSPGSPVSLLRVADQRPALTITGSIDGLVRDVPASLVLTVHSAGAAAVVRTIVASATSVSTPGCALGALAITPWSGYLDVPAGGQASVRLRVLLGAGCNGATWTLAYAST